MKTMKECVWDRLWMLTHNRVYDVLHSRDFIIVAGLTDFTLWNRVGGAVLHEIGKRQSQ